jgi:hypothetical protein
LLAERDRAAIPERGEISAPRIGKEKPGRFRPGLKSSAEKFRADIA